MKEEILEPLLRKFRIARVLPVLKKVENCSLLDIGCGWNARFLNEVSPYIGTGVGIDAKAPSVNSKKITTICARIDKKLPFDDATFDVVTMLAVLEHLSQPEDVVREVKRVLRPGGIFCGIVPSKAAKPVLEFLSFKLHIVNPLEISDHKTYFTKNTLGKMFSSIGFTSYEHNYFQLFMNNFFIAQV